MCIYHIWLCGRLTEAINIKSLGQCFTCKCSVNINIYEQFFVITYSSYGISILEFLISR